MAYQPPLIGFKQLLNFGAYSVPDTGGWIFIAAGMAVMFCVIYEWKRHKQFKIKVSVAVLLLPFLFSSCTSGTEAITTGKDNCYFCKMTISDPKFGAELVTKKGKVYKFDDMHCLFAFIKTKAVDDAQVKDIYLVDFAGNHSLVKAADGFFIQGGAIRGPMNGNVIAFKNKDSMKNTITRFNATEVNWQQLTK
jgi:copper chaperone NosL